MKKYIFVALIVFGGVVPASAFAATLSVSPASGTYQTGNIVTAQIMLDTQGAPIEGVDIRYLNYNPALLEVQDENASVAGVQIAPGTLMLNTVANTVNVSLGRIEFSQVISGNATYTGNGVLATVRFRALASGTATVSFNAILDNTADTNIASGGADILSSAAPAVYAIIIPPVQQLAPIIYLSPSSSSKVTGATFPLDIMIDTRGSAIDGADIVMSYNRTLIKITDADVNRTGTQITPGALMQNTTANDVSESTGRITFSQTTPAQGVFSGSGVVATITARAIAPGAANFTFTFRKGVTNDTNLSLNGTDLLDVATNATVQISENYAAPMITSTNPSGVVTLTRSMALSVSTNESATCRYSQTPGVDYMAMTRYFSSSDGIVHTTTLSSGFQSGVNNFYARCRDKAGNVMNTDAVISFFITTDTVAPFIAQTTPSGTFFSPKNIHIGVVPQDQSGVASCKFSFSPNTHYDAMPRTLSLRRLAPPFFISDDSFSTILSGRDLHLGQNNFYVRCKDKTGNANMTDTVISFTLFSPPSFMVGVEGHSTTGTHTFTVSLFAPGTTAEIVKMSARPNNLGVIVLTIDNTSQNMVVGPGPYDVRVSSDKYLARKFANLFIGAGAVIAIPPLLAGDLNADGVINSLDWSIMNTQWSVRSSIADINKDGIVNSLDWGYVRKNWLAIGA